MKEARLRRELFKTKGIKEVMNDMKNKQQTKRIKMENGAMKYMKVISKKQRKCQKLRYKAERKSSGKSKI